jgi:hypothetical protein
MVLNDALKQHRKCLMECEEKLKFCEYDPPRNHNCQELRDACQILCDFDHSPN